MVLVRAVWVIWSMMRYNVGRMAGSTAAGWSLAGSQLFWVMPGGGNDDGYDVGSMVMHSASSVV